MLEFAELFSGAGGMALGLKNAGFRPSWAVDWNQDACQTYRRNLGSHAICSKVEEVDFELLPRVDGLAFGFPCNDFSVVGEKKGVDGYFGGLYKYAEKAISALNPIWFIAENVPGLMASSGNDIMREFASAGQGYNLSVHLYRFEEYGVPQRRWRVIGVGIRSDFAKTFLPPCATHLHPIGAKEAFSGVELVSANNEVPVHSDKVIRLLEAIPPGENCWSDAVPQELKLKVKGAKMSLIYRRLHPQLPSYTLVASGGGGTHGYHYEFPRALTNRERARLQTFPDDFIFEGTPGSVRKQIGMAVPPVGAEVIGSALMKTLIGCDYDNVLPSIGIFTSLGSKIEQPHLFEALA